MPGGLALAILRYDEGDGFNRSGVVTEAHAMTLQLLAAVVRIPGGDSTLSGICVREAEAARLTLLCKHDLLALCSSFADSLMWVRGTGNPFMDRQRLSDFYIHYHFLNFAKLYNNERVSGGGSLITCRLHLQVRPGCCSLPPGQAHSRRMPPGRLLLAQPRQQRFC